MALFECPDDPRVIIKPRAGDITVPPGKPLSPGDSANMRPGHYMLYKYSKKHDPLCRNNHH
jgi:hypothetical protein